MPDGKGPSGPVPWNGKQGEEITVTSDGVEEITVTSDEDEVNPEIKEVYRAEMQMGSLLINQKKDI